MPEMDGIELAQHTAKAAPQTQVMFITGFAAVSLRAEENVPQAQLLSKPFHLKDLVLEAEPLFGRPDRSHQKSRYDSLDGLAKTRRGESDRGLPTGGGGSARCSSMG